MKTPTYLKKSLLAASLALVSTSAAFAHHGFGLFQLDKHVKYSGTLTKMELVNPHSYMYFDAIQEDGSVIAMRCEMRAATLIRRSGWSTDMFKPGAHVEIEGNPHRDDPGACYLENFTLDDSEAINRNAQFSISATDTSDRPARLASGEPNISGDWAVEQLVLTVPPEGGNGAMVPSSKRAGYASGELSIEDIRAASPPRVSAAYTAKGQEAASAFRMWSPEDNPRLSCNPTSIIFDWTFDWPISQIEQKVTADGEKVIDFNYGLYSLFRRIHMEQYQHPAELTPDSQGHSIGHWEGDTLVVDTLGFPAGVLTPPTRHSDQLHIVERFTLDTATMALKREYTATDPVYLTEPYSTYDVVYPSAVPYQTQECKELTPEFKD